jgi:hypothetical protein
MNGFGRNVVESSEAPGRHGVETKKWGRFKYIYNLNWESHLISGTGRIKKRDRFKILKPLSANRVRVVGGKLSFSVQGPSAVHDITTNLNSTLHQ